jgi:hypothetical protein
MIAVADGSIQGSGSEFFGNVLGAPPSLDLADGEVKGELFKFNDRFRQPQEPQAMQDHATGTRINLAALIRGTADKAGHCIFDDRLVVDRAHPRTRHDLALAAT